MNSIKLKIADIVIECRSAFPVKRLTKKEKGYLAPGRYAGAFVSGSCAPDIVIDVEVIKELPVVDKTKTIFVTYHVDDGLENWRLLEAKKGHVYQSSIEGKEQVIFVDLALDRAKAYLLPKKGRMCWHVSDLIYDFLQILLIHYLAKRRLGFFIHAAGVKDGSSGFVFAGESGAGKSTTARIWHRYTDAVILNDDRVIVRPFGKSYKIYGSPWHGEFGKYLADSKVSAVPANLFFIHQTRSNHIQPLSVREAFLRLYPVLFPTFWDRVCLKNITDLAQSMLECVPAFQLGLCKKKTAVDFVRSFCRGKK
jgi:hypothetical protein